MRRSALPFVLLLACAALVQASPQVSRRADLYRAVLQLHASDLQGRRWDHDRLQGRIVLVDFWATWCAPCLRELPYLKRARAQYGDDFEILGISLDTMQPDALRRWLGRNGIGWPQVHASDGYDDGLAMTFGIDRLPTNLLLDRKGRLRAVDVRRDDLFSEVNKLLAEERAASR